MLEGNPVEAPAAATESVTSQPEAPEQSTEKEGSPSQAQPEKSDSIATPANAETLRKLLRREKEDPNIKFTDAELDLYEAYTAGKLKPAKKPAPHKAASPKTEETDTGHDSPSLAETDVDEGEDSKDAEDEGDGAAPDPMLDSLMKEVGAKKPEEILAKVKELRRSLGGRDAQTVKKLSDQVQNEKNLWEDVRKGVPAAIAHAEKAYGFKIAQPGQSQDWTPVKPQPSPGEKPKGQNGRAYISEDAFIDPESAKMVNDILRQRDEEIDDLRSLKTDFQQEKERNRQQAAHQEAQRQVIDEMVRVAQRMDALKGIGNLRESIASWYSEGRSDSRLDAFNELFELAQREGCSLEAASTLKRGMDADRLIAEAEERGRKAAYGHKANPSLSGQQGGKGEIAYQNLTEDQIDAMSDDHRLMPPDWFDKDEKPLQNRVPKKAWRIFGFKG